MAELETGAAEAAPVETAIAEAPVVETPSEAPEAPKAERAEPSKSVADSIDRALKSLNKTEAKPEGDRPRTPDGKFAPKAETPAQAEVAKPLPETAKPQEAADAPPAWLNEAAKAEFAKVPPAVRAEIGRRTAELEKGINEYRARFEPLREYDELARQSGTTIHDALRNYVGIERTLRADPVKGLETICQNMGLDLRQVAEHVLKMPPKTEQERQVERQLAAQQEQLRQLQEQNTRHVTSMIERFAAENPRFEELSEDIAAMLKSGYATSLEDAYAKADRLKPAPAPQPAAAHTPAPPAAQTREPAQTSKLSLDGAPGSNPGPARSKSPQEALQRAAARVGLSL